MQKAKKVNPYMDALRKKSESKQSLNTDKKEVEPKMEKANNPQHGKDFSSAKHQFLVTYSDTKQFGEVAKRLMYLTVNTQNPKAPSQKCEEVLNWLGYTSIQEGFSEKNFLNKEEIQELRFELLEEFQTVHPDFASVREVKEKFPAQVKKLETKCGRDKLLLYNAVKTAMSLPNESYNLIISEKAEMISRGFYPLKASEETKNLLFPLAKEIGELMNEKILSTQEKLDLEQEEITAEYSDDTTEERVKTVLQAMQIAKNPVVMNCNNWMEIIHDPAVEFCLNHKEELERLEAVLQALNIDYSWLKKNFNTIESFLTKLIA